MHIIFMRSWNRNGKRFGSCISLFSKNNKFPCYQRSTQVIYMHFYCINHYNHLVWYDIDTRAYEGRWFFFLHLDKDRFWAKSHQNQNCTIVRSVLFMRSFIVCFFFLLSQIYDLLYVGFYICLIRFIRCIYNLLNFFKLTETFPL